MPKIYIHFSFLFLLLTALSGVWMRLFPFYPDMLLTYSNVLHGHSHLAILGWAFLGVFIIFLRIFWKTITAKKQAIAICFSLFLVSFIMFLAFLYQGYGVFSIIMSTIHIFVEYWAAVFIYKQLKRQKKLPQVARFFFNGALISLIISSIGPFLLGFISANGMKESPIFDMAIYFYLHFQYNGWLTLFLIGLFYVILLSKQIAIKEDKLKIGFWFYFIALFPGYFLSVLWMDDLGIFANIFADIGSVGQFIGIVTILVTFYAARDSLKNYLSKVTFHCLQFTFLLLFLKSTMELGLMIPDLAALVYDTRSVIIGYLHLTLLGFVSIFILTQYQMDGILRPSRLLTYGFIIFFTGFMLNELLLFLQSLIEWVAHSTIPYYNEGLLIASITLAIGVFILWIAVKNNQA